MKINLRTLKEAVNQLPPPTHSGQREPLKVLNRIDSLMRGVNADNFGSKERAIEYNQLTVIAVKYCYSENDCWLEWELIIK